MRFSTLALVALLPLATQAADHCPKLAGEYVLCGPQGTKSAVTLTATQEDSADGAPVFTLIRREPIAYERKSVYIADAKDRSIQSADDSVLQTNASCDGRSLLIDLEERATPTAKHITSRAKIDYILLHSAHGPILIERIMSQSNPGAVVSISQQKISRTQDYFARDAATCDEFAKLREALRNN